MEKISNITEFLLFPSHNSRQPDLPCRLQQNGQARSFQVVLQASKETGPICEDCHNNLDIDISVIHRSLLYSFVEDKWIVRRLSLVGAI